MGRAYLERRQHRWWGVWPFDLRRLLHLVPRGVEFSVVGSQLIGRRALCGKKLVAQEGGFHRDSYQREPEEFRKCSRCVRAQRAEQKRLAQRRI